MRALWAGKAAGRRRAHRPASRSALRQGGPEAIPGFHCATALFGKIGRNIDELLRTAQRDRTSMWVSARSEPPPAVTPDGDAQQPWIRNVGKLRGLGVRLPFALRRSEKMIFMRLAFHPFPEQIGQLG